jgi:hypothetical protein
MQRPPLPLLALTPPSARQYLPFALIWLAIALSVVLVVELLHLPARMDCTNSGHRQLHCKHSLLSPELWRRL